MRSTGLQGVHRRRARGCTRRDEAATPSADLVERRFTPDGPDRLYVADVTQHRTSEGWLYYAVVIDCFSRRVVGWSIADHIRSELVVDALQMAIWNRRPEPGDGPSQRSPLDRRIQLVVATPRVRKCTPTATGDWSKKTSDAPEELRRQWACGSGSAAADAFAWAA